MRSSRIFSGDFHTPNQKTRILPLFLRFLLAFPVFLGYSPCRPSISRKIEGSRTLGACFDRIGACPDCLGVESKIRRISRLDVQANDQGEDRGSPASVESVERRCPEIVLIFWREFWPPGGLRNQAPGGFSLCGLRRRLPLEEFTRSRKYFLQRLDVRNDIADLRRVEHIFHSRHQRIAGFDPLCQRGRGNGVSVHGKRSPLGNAFQPGADFLLIARRKMADGALLLEHFLAARYRSRSGMAR